jgi:hypothetical protein
MHPTPVARWLLILAVPAAAAARLGGAEPVDLFGRGTAVGLDRALPANERGILCLAVGARGRLYGGTTGRAAHLFVCDTEKGEVRSLARLPGGVGFAYQLLRLPDGSLVGGTQADPTGIALQTDPGAVGHLYRFTAEGDGPARVEDLGVPVPGQGIYTLAYSPSNQEVLGNTWPDGHFFAFYLRTRKFTDHGPLAGHRTYEAPPQAEDINRGTDQKVRYPRQVSRAIAVHDSGAYTGGADGYLQRYDFATRKVEKLAVRLPAVRGREPWASLDAGVFYPWGRDHACLLGGTSDGYLFELRIYTNPTRERGADVSPTRQRGDNKRFVLRPWGKPLAQGTIQGLVVAPAGADFQGVYGVGGLTEGMPRSFAWAPEGESAGVYPGGIPHVDGAPSMSGFGSLVAGPDGDLWAGERDRIARLVRFSRRPKEVKKDPPPPQPPLPPATEIAPRWPFHVVFAPQGTTTDGSGYTALEVGKDGRVYAGAARYGDYAWLLRFDPAARPLFMDKVVSLRQLTGENLQGINTHGKIHAKILVGADGRVWFASKQAHEIFETRPEYGEEGLGFPGGHLCYYDPKTGFSRSLGILKKQEGVVAGAIDDGRGKLYYRSEPKNHFLVYDLATGEVRDRGNVGAACRYMTTDRAGAVYTVGRGKTLCRYDPQTGYVEDLAVKVEGPGGYDAPYVVAVGPNGKLYGAGTSHPFLMEFDIDAVRLGPFPEVVMRNVAAAAPPGFPVQDIHAAVFGKDGRLYYPLNTTGPIEKGGKPVPHLCLMRFDPATKKVETIGIPEPKDFDEEKVKHAYARKDRFRLYYMQGAAVAPDGTLFLMGIYPQLHVAWFPKLTAPGGR